MSLLLSLPPVLYTIFLKYTDNARRKLKNWPKYKIKSDFKFGSNSFSSNPENISINLDELKKNGARDIAIKSKRNAKIVTYPFLPEKKIGDFFLELDTKNNNNFFSIVIIYNCNGFKYKDYWFGFLVNRDVLKDPSYQIRFSKPYWSYIRGYFCELLKK